MARAFGIRAIGKKRRASGATIILIAALLGGFAITLLLFTLQYTRYLGSYQEQRKAIEASALVAAKDLGRIVINDPNFGYIGLSDYAPTGKSTQAGDRYYLSVQSINTVLATIRLDMIIADYLEDPVMKQLALVDYNNALVAQTNLASALNAAVLPGGSGSDVDGNTITPMDDAISAYMQNPIRLSGKSSSLHSGSLKLSLGYVSGLGTQTVVPSPQSVDQLTETQTRNGYYLPNVAINYGTTPFVFAAVGQDASLVDFKQFSAELSNVTHATPSVVRADADEDYQDVDMTGRPLQRTVHAVAAAVPGSITDQRPCPGAFTISFPDGTVPELASPGDLINSTQLNMDPVDALQTADTGDYPQTPLTPFALNNLPVLDKAHPPLEDALSCALYDWLKRGGPHTNVQAVVSMMTTPLAVGSGNPQMIRFHINSQGLITQDSIPFGHTNLCVSQKQWRALSGLGLLSKNGRAYDLQLTDFVAKPGKLDGGKHGGEPLDNPGTDTANAAAANYVGPTIYENYTWPYLSYLEGPNEGAPRPTYTKDGIAVDFTVRLH